MTWNMDTLGRQRMTPNDPPTFRTASLISTRSTLAQVRQAHLRFLMLKKTCSQANDMTSMYRTKVVHTLMQRKLISTRTNWSDFYDNMAEIKGGTCPLMTGLFQYNHTWTFLYRKNCLLIHNAFTKRQYVRCFVFSLFCSPKVVNK